MIPVELTYPHEGVALIQMCDQAGANTFSAELLAGLQSSFSSVSSDESVRAVVMEQRCTRCLCLALCQWWQRCKGTLLAVVFR